jgi:hypothetical protein
MAVGAVDLFDDLSRLAELNELVEGLQERGVRRGRDGGQRMPVQQPEVGSLHCEGVHVARLPVLHRHVALIHPVYMEMRKRKGGDTRQAGRQAGRQRRQTGRQAAQVGCTRAGYHRATTSHMP